MVQVNTNQTLNKKASYPYVYPMAFLPADSRISRLQMNPAHGDQIKASEIQSALVTITYEAQQINQTMTHFVVALPELKAKLLRLAQFVAYAYSLLEPEMRLLAQHHNYTTSTSALEATLKEEMPDELQADLLRDYTIYDRYFSVVRVPSLTLHEFTAQVANTCLGVLVDLPYTVLGVDEIVFIVQVIELMFKLLVREFNADPEEQIIVRQAQRSWVRQHPMSWLRDASQQLNHQILWWWMRKRPLSEQKKWTHDVSFYRWVVGHHLFDLCAIFCSEYLLRASASCAREQEIEEGAEFLGLAADFLRGTTASMWYASNFPKEIYEADIRPSMVSTNTPLGFSGQQNVEYTRMKHSKEHLVETLFKCYGRDLSGWPETAYDAFKAFHEIDIEDNEHHVLIAISKSGTDTSLFQKVRKGRLPAGKQERNAADVLREMVDLKRRKFKFPK